VIARQLIPGVLAHIFALVHLNLSTSLIIPDRLARQFVL
jgi:hypothetical protein